MFTDLNPIENSWCRLKELFQKQFPNIINEKYSEDEIRLHIKNVLKWCWNELENEYFMALLKSLPRRIETVIKGKGWCAKC